jgi:trigger factor
MELKKVEKVENNVVELEVSVGKEEFDEAREKAYRKNASKMNVPGFRKGKAPRKIIEKLYGEGIFFDDAMNICYPEAYDKAVEEAGIDPVDSAKVEIVDLSCDGFTFKAKVAVKPEVKIEGYKGLSAPKKVMEVNDEDISEELNRLAMRNSRIVAVDRPVTSGDTVTLDFEGFCDGKAFDGGKAEKYELKVVPIRLFPVLKTADRQSIGRRI